MAALRPTLFGLYPGEILLPGARVPSSSNSGLGNLCGPGLRCPGDHGTSPEQHLRRFGPDRPARHDDANRQRENGLNMSASLPTHDAS